MRSPSGGLVVGVVLMVLEVILVVLGVVLVVLGLVLIQCSEQMFGTDNVRNFKRLVSASMKSYRPHLLTQASYGPKLHVARF